VYWDDFSLSDPLGPGGGQQFGYDGFGNLLSQAAIFGSSPFMTLAVNPNTNQVTGTGVVFDAAGNMTQDGGVSYAYDSMNRLTSAGPLSYSYSPGENKRMVVYGTYGGDPTPQLNMYLCGPNGKLLSKFLYEPSGSAWDAVPGSQTNYFYLGGKTLNWAENNIGSNAASQFWPYGQGAGVFATYQPDLSGFLYADQRYYNQAWGRIVTADPSSNHRRGLRSSGAWNKYSYALGDPINRNDKHGTCSDMVAGISQGPFYDTLAGAAATDVFQLATSLGAVSAFPYSGIDKSNSVLLVDDQSLLGFYGVGTSQSVTAGLSINFAISQSPTGGITLYCFSGGAQACNTAVTTAGINPASINYVFYLSPGLGPLTGLSPILDGTQGTFVISNPASPTDAAAGIFAQYLSGTSQGPPIQYLQNTCDHDFVCSMTQAATSSSGDLSITPQLYSGGKCNISGFFSGMGGTPDPDNDDDDDDDDSGTYDQDKNG
jgi:RHS repeat-associated protein